MDFRLRIVIGTLIVTIGVLFSAAAYLVLDKRSPPKTATAASPATLSNISIVASEFGTGWTGPNGVRIEDIENITLLDPSSQTVAKTLQKAMGPFGVRAVADFNYTKSAQKASEIPTVVTVKLLAFKSEQHAKQFFRQKYYGVDNVKLYKSVDAIGYLAVDSTQTPKRIALFKNYVVTSGTLLNDARKTHIRFLNRYLAKINKTFGSPEQLFIKSPEDKSSERTVQSSRGRSKAGCIDRCGDNQCASRPCQGKDCSCKESHLTCPSDCCEPRHGADGIPIIQEGCFVEFPPIGKKKRSGGADIWH
jgi:hypothetical protein